MLKYDDLLTWFQDLGYIIYDTHISIDNLQRIRQPANEIEKQVLKIGFFSHFYLQSRFTVIVQLSKVFDENDNQKRNFLKLFNRLTKDTYDKKLKDALKRKDNNLYLLFSSKSEIIDFVNLLKIKIDKHSEIIKKVVTIRNKLYAHSDPDPNIPIVTDEEITSLVRLADKIFNDLYTRFFYTKYAFKHTNKWKIEPIIKILSELNKTDIERHFYPSE